MTTIFVLRALERLLQEREAVDDVRVTAAHPAPWTAEDLYELPEEGMRHELLDGTLLVTPPPSVPHQLAARRLVAALAEAAGPDLDVLEAVGVAVPAALLVPDVVIAEAYAEAGIGTYLRVGLDDVGGATVLAFSLEAGRSRQTGTAFGGSRTELLVPFSIQLDAAALRGPRA